MSVGVKSACELESDRGSIVACRVLDKSRNTAPLELWLFRASTTGGAGLADTDPFNPTDTQLANLAGVIRIDDWFAGSTENSIGQATNLPLSFTDLTGGSLYAWLVARGAANYTGTSHLTVQLEVLKD